MDLSIPNHFPNQFIFICWLKDERYWNGRGSNHFYIHFGSHCPVLPKSKKSLVQPKVLSFNMSLMKIDLDIKMACTKFRPPKPTFCILCIICRSSSELAFAWQQSVVFGTFKVFEKKIDFAKFGQGQVTFYVPSHMRTSVKIVPSRERSKIMFCVKRVGLRYSMMGLAR